MSSFEKYKDYSEKDFINDTFFQDFILTNEDRLQNFWNEFLEAYPDKKATVEDARNFLKNLSFRMDEPEEHFVQQALTQHLSSIKDLKETKVIALNKTTSLRSFLRIAAVTIGIIILASAVIIFKTKNEKLIVKTGFGKMQSVILPDSSMVVLNANSTIEFYKNWKSGNKREVWLNGEAFFDVKHLNKNPSQVKAHERFLLYTRHADIEVLGTSFDVRERRDKTEVVLQTGSIKVAFANKKLGTVFMQPGDLLTYDEKQQDIIKSTTIPENYAAWKERKLLLVNPTVTQIVQYLEDNYGKKIMLQQAEQGKIKIEGPIMLNSLEDALFILSTVLNSRVSEKNNIINISPR